MLNFELDKKLKPHLAYPFAVAVSGGADSLALVFYLWELVQKDPSRLKAFIVDHQLRLESLEEAKTVQLWLTEKQIPCEILSWNHPPISSNIQELARDARYDLLLNACLDQNFSSLWVGHHLLDQYETVLMRFSRGSGIQGLSGMPPVCKRKGIAICRPFLDLKPELLIESLENHPYIQDPSNKNEKYERIRWRKQTPLLSQLGITLKSIKDTVSKLQKENEALHWMVEEWFEKNATWVDPLKYYYVPYFFHRMPESIVKRIMLRMASRVTGVEKTTADVRHHMEAAYERLLGNRPFTFAGCYWKLWRKGLICVREWGLCQPQTIEKPFELYDHRFPIETPQLIEPLGKGSTLHPTLLKLKKNHPVEAFYSLPKVFNREL